MLPPHPPFIIDYDDPQLLYINIHFYPIKSAF